MSDLWGGEGEFWLEPEEELAKNHRFSVQQLNQIQSIVEAHRDERRSAWRKGFKRRGS